MKRDMELCRKILFKIEKEYVDTALIDLKIDGYTTEEVADHCKLLYEAGLVSDYKSQYANGHIYIFNVGSLTWEGHDFLDKIREDTVWHKTKEVITKKGLPMVLKVVESIASTIIASMTEGAIKAITEKGGV